MDFFTAQVRITDEYGMHARPAAALASAAAKFKADIRLKWQEQEADAKSILEILSLAAPKDAELTLDCNGSDAELAGKTLCSLFQNRLAPLE